MHLDSRLKAHALQLTSIGVPNSLTAEADDDPSWDRKVGYIAIGALRRTSDEFRSVGRDRDCTRVTGKPEVETGVAS